MRTKGLAACFFVFLFLGICIPCTAKDEIVAHGILYSGRSTNEIASWWEKQPGDTRWYPIVSSSDSKTQVWLLFKQKELSLDAAKRDLYIYIFDSAVDKDRWNLLAIHHGIETDIGQVSLDVPNRQLILKSEGKRLFTESLDGPRLKPDPTKE